MYVHNTVPKMRAVKNNSLVFSLQVRDKLKQELAESQHCISELQAENTRLHVDSGTMGLLVQPHTSLNELRWRQGESAPVLMTRGSVCSHNNKVYFNPCFSNTVYCYTLTEGTTHPLLAGSSKPSGDTHIQGRKAEHKDSAPSSDDTTADSTGETTASHQTQRNEEKKEKRTIKRATSEGPLSEAAENTPTGAWSILPACPYQHFSLAVVKGALTTIGGAQSSTHKTGSLLSLSCPGQQWVERLPCMPTERSYTTAATSGKLLVVVGGEGQGAKKLGTVEVMNIHTEQWQSAAWLPVAVTLASSTVCGGQIYIGGGFDKNTHEDCSVYTCSLARLVTQPARKSRSLSLVQRAEHSVWRAIQDVPLAGAALVSVCGQLLAVGGKTRASGASSTLVHRSATQ